MSRENKTEEKEALSIDDCLVALQQKGCRKIGKDVESSQEKKYKWLLNIRKEAEPYHPINVHVNNKEMSFYAD